MTAWCTWNGTEMRVYACPGNEHFADVLAARLTARRGDLSWHRFPDGETRVRVDTPPDGEQACIVCTLADPDPKFLPLLFTAKSLRDIGASRVGLVAPYLAYMRQDMQFHPGEAVSSRYFCGLLSDHFDWLATVDPHLHRTRELSDLFPQSSCTVHVGVVLAEWIKANVRRPYLIGPDGESAQWVSAAAEHIGAPWTTLLKERLGDRQVRISLSDGAMLKGHEPVLVDDIIASGETLAAAARHLRGLGLPAPLCVAIHGVFAADARAALQAAGVGRVAVSNTILQPEAVIDVTPRLAEGVSWLAAGEVGGV